MRKLVLALIAALALSTMTAGLTSAGPAKPIPFADLTVCTQTMSAVDYFAFTVSWGNWKNPYEVRLYTNSAATLTGATDRGATRIGHHPSPFSFLGQQSNYTNLYVIAVVENRKDQGPSDSYLLSNAVACEPS